MLYYGYIISLLFKDDILLHKSWSHIYITKAELSGTKKTERNKNIILTNIIIFNIYILFFLIFNPILPMEYYAGQVTENIFWFRPETLKKISRLFLVSTFIEDGIRMLFNAR